MNDLPVLFRLAAHTDNNFIYGSWLPSERNNIRLTPKEIYTKEQTNKIKYILSHSQTMVAYLDPLPNEPEILLAYIVYQYLHERLIIHYAFTKNSFRNKGIQRMLINLINILHTPIILTAIPQANILKTMQKTTNIIYDHYYFERKTYGE